MRMKGAEHAVDSIDEMVRVVELYHGQEGVANDEE